MQLRTRTLENSEAVGTGTISATGRRRSSLAVVKSPPAGSFIKPNPTPAKRGKQPIIGRRTTRRSLAATSQHSDLPLGSAPSAALSPVVEMTRIDSRLTPSRHASPLPTILVSPINTPARTTRTKTPTRTSKTPAVTRTKTPTRGSKTSAVTRTKTPARPSKTPAVTRTKTPTRASKTSAVTRTKTPTRSTEPRTPARATKTPARIVGSKTPTRATKAKTTAVDTLVEPVLSRTPVVRLTRTPAVSSRSVRTTRVNTATQSRMNTRSRTSLLMSQPRDAGVSSRPSLLDESLIKFSPGRRPPSYHQLFGSSSVSSVSVEYDRLAAGDSAGVVLHSGTPQVDLLRWSDTSVETSPLKPHNRITTDARTSQQDEQSRNERLMYESDEMRGPLSGLPRVVNCVLVMLLVLLGVAGAVLLARELGARQTVDDLISSVYLALLAALTGCQESLFNLIAPLYSALLKGLTWCQESLLNLIALLYSALQGVVSRFQEYLGFNTTSP